MPIIRTLLAGAVLAGAALTAQADNDVEGAIESLDPSTQTLVVAGKSIQTDARTDYDDDLTNFADLKVGDRVEVDFRRDGDRLIATEIERD